MPGQLLIKLVSILVLMDVAFELLLVAFVVIRLRVSILVLMDVAFEFCVRPQQMMNRIEFQSLFLWMLLLNILLTDLAIFMGYVSILVLMDVAFEFVLPILKKV